MIDAFVTSIIGDMVGYEYLYNITLVIMAVIFVNFIFDIFRWFTRIFK